MTSLRPLCVLPALLWLPVAAGAARVSDPAPPAGLPDTGAGAPLRSIALLPDGRLVYSLDESGELLARDQATGKTRFRGSLGADAVKLRVLRGGSLLVGFDDGSVRLIGQPVEGKALEAKHVYAAAKLAPASPTVPSPRATLEDVCVSPDGTRFAVLSSEVAFNANRVPTGARTARLRVWKLADDQTPIEVAALPAPLKYTGLFSDTGLPRIAWSDDKTLVVARSDVSLRRLDASTGAVRSEWKPPAEAAVKIDPAKDEAAFQARLQKMPPEMQERMRLSHERAKERAAKTPADPNAPLDFGATRGLSSDGRLLLSSTRNGYVLWNTSDNSQRALEKSERLTGGETVFSSDDKMVAVCAGGGFWLWNADGSQIGQARIPSHNFSDLIFSPAGAQLWMADGGGAVRAWPTSAPLSQSASVTLPGFFAPWKALIPVQDGLFAATSGRVARIDAAGTARWFDAPAVDGPGTLAQPQSPEKLSIKALAASPDGRLWAESVGSDSYSREMEEKGVPSSEVRGRDAQSGAVLWRLPNESRGHPVSLLRFLPDGTLLIGGESGGMRRRGLPANPFAGLRARDGKTGQTKDLGIAWGDKNGLSEPGSVEILEPSANGKRLVVSSGSGGNGIQIVDLESKKVLSFFGANSDLPRGAWATSPDGHFLAGPSDDGVGVWDLSKTRGFPNAFAPDFKLSFAPVARPHLNALAWSQTNTLAAAFPDGRVLAWTPGFQTGQAAAWETAPGRAVTSLAWSLDGKTLSSGDERGDLQTRDAQTGTLQSTIRLLPPATEGGAPGWVRWTRDGKITSPAKP